MWLGVISRTDTKRSRVNKDWTTCSEYDNHLNFISEHTGVGGGYMTTKPLSVYATRNGFAT